MGRSLNTQLTETDHVAACQIHARRSTQYLLACALIALAGYLIYNIPTLPNDVQFVGLLATAAAVGVLIAGLALTPLRVAWQARRLFHQTKGLTEPTAISWDNERVSFKAETWFVTTLWSDFLKWREGPDHILLYLNNISFRLIPKRDFADQASLEDFTALMKAKVRAA